MVRFLVFDIFDDAVLGIDRASERPVSALPVGEAGEWMVCFDPFSGSHLDFLHEVGEGDGGVQAAQDMDVVVGAADAVEMPVVFFDDAPDVAIQLLTAFFEQHGFAVFCGEHDVV